MQRFATLCLTVALTTLVAAVSVALLAAAWLMTTYVLNEPGRLSLLNGLFR